MLPAPPPRTYNRRQILGASLAAGLGAAAGLSLSARPARAAPGGNHHLVWVWQFSTDGDPEKIGIRLRDNRLGIILKTHDGVTWMSEYDTSRYAVSGQPQVGVLANYFENAGVPFHAWCVLHGSDPIREAHMAAAVLLSGARSLFLDVEPHSGFWRGSAQDAIRFGQEVRRLAPDAELILSIDARPWLKNAIPLREFAAFVNAIALQQYWKTFATQANYEKYLAAGHPVVEGSLTPEFLLATTTAAYQDTGLPMHHTGQGSTEDPLEWHRFVDSALAAGTDYVSVWRYGVTPEIILNVLRDKPARQPAPAAVAAAGSHTVQSGETLGIIAAQYGTTVDAIVQANGLSDPNYIYVGQELAIPGAAQAAAAPPGGTTASTAATAAAASSATGGGTTYVVQQGDTLFSIATRHDTTVSAIAAANSLNDPNYIYVGQQLLIA